MLAYRRYGTGLDSKPRYSSAWASNFWAAKARDKEQLLDAEGLASAERDYLLEARGVAGPLARGEGL